MAVPTNCTAPDWHTLSIPDTLTYLKTSPDGLAPAEAQQRLAQYGPNELEETHARSRWDILLDQFKNVMLLLLIAVAILSGVL
ncbi:MAG: cation-transporting P-type ATPase, partial [Chloracidobacterium sp.]|nr:cation-transporting P-type ATPase [Chloracidobacterium sp.]